MAKYLLISLLCCLWACNRHPDASRHTPPPKKDGVEKIYATSVKDSFTIFTALPDTYDAKGKQRFPVVYLLDANLYFDIMATALRRYAEVGLAPEVILVGIGYKDMQVMDSLRNRDYTYPLAIPEYEMTTSGGADKMLSFFDEQLIPYIDSTYLTDATRRVLMGHSLGGYFTLFTLQQQLKGATNKWHGFVAASPSLHYNGYYLLDRMAETPATVRPDKMKAFVTYGGLEDPQGPTDSTVRRQALLMKQLNDYLPVRQVGCLRYKGEIYSNLDHMDTQLPTFLKGLQWTLAQEE